MGEALLGQLLVLQVDPLISLDSRPENRQQLLAFFGRTANLPIALYSRRHGRAEIRSWLDQLSVAQSRFLDIRVVAADEEPAVLEEWVKKLLVEGAAGAVQRLFWFGQDSAEMRASHNVQLYLQRQHSNCLVIALALRNIDGDSIIDLEKSGATYVAADLTEAVDLITAPRAPLSVSFILLAFNEAKSLPDCIADVRHVARDYIDQHEIIVVDDGSSDGTAALVNQLNRGDLTLIQHPDNLGMGASMRDGYLAARLDYLVALPADRQVRAHSLVPFFAKAAPLHVVASFYKTAHAGKFRELLSWGFRWFTKHLGGLTIDFAGAYLFPRQLLDGVRWKQCQANSFVFSFELLQQFHRLGARRQEVWIHPFLRDFGKSRELKIGRMLRVMGEIIKSRWRRMLH